MTREEALIDLRSTREWPGVEVKLLTAEIDPAAIRVPACERPERQGRVRPDHAFSESIHTRRAMTFAAARDACTRIAAPLSARCVGANDRVALAGANALEFVLIYRAVLCRGMMRSRSPDRKRAP